MNLPTWMENGKCTAETAAARREGPAQARRIADSWFPPNDRVEGPPLTRAGRRELAVYARALCAGCPVIAQCAAFATADLTLRGIWGGMPHAERVERVKGRVAA